MPKNTKDMSAKNDNINDTKFKKHGRSTSKKSAPKDSVAKKKNSSKSSIQKNSTSKNTSIKKKTTSKKVTSKSTSRGNSSKTKITKKPEIIEYYDLPYRYNQTIVKILAQTPTTLFVYWDISDEDRNALISSYGENFFTETRPVLVVHNLTYNYSFEIEINDFANSWYIRTQEPNCDYVIELGDRKSVV